MIADAALLAAILTALAGAAGLPLLEHHRRPRMDPVTVYRLEEELELPHTVPPPPPDAGDAWLAIAESLERFNGRMRAMRHAEPVVYGEPPASRSSPPAPPLPRYNYTRGSVDHPDGSGL